MLAAGILLMLLALLVNSGPLFHLSSWKTQEVLYRSRSHKDHRIEFQMRDIGALGYRRRIVEVKPFLFFDLPSEIDTAGINKKDWYRVDEYVNELEMKGG
jgi:hypothetical protein